MPTNIQLYLRLATTATTTPLPGVTTSITILTVILVTDDTITIARRAVIITTTVIDTTNVTRIAASPSTIVNRPTMTNWIAVTSEDSLKKSQWIQKVWTTTTCQPDMKTGFPASDEGHVCPSPPTHHAHADELNSFCFRTRGTTVLFAFYFQYLIDLFHLRLALIVTARILKAKCLLSAVQLSITYTVQH